MVTLNNYYFTHIFRCTNSMCPYMHKLKTKQQTSPIPAPVSGMKFNVLQLLNWSSFLSIFHTYHDYTHSDDYASEICY